MAARLFERACVLSGWPSKQRHPLEAQSAPPLLKQALLNTAHRSAGHLLSSRHRHALGRSAFASERVQAAPWRSVYLQCAALKFSLDQAQRVSVSDDDL